MSGSPFNRLDCGEDGRLSVLAGPSRAIPEVLATGYHTLTEILCIADRINRSRLGSIGYVETLVLHLSLFYVTTALSLWLPPSFFRVLIVAFLLFQSNAQAVPRSAGFPTDSFVDPV